MQYQYFIGVMLPAQLSNKINAIQNSVYSKDIMLKPLVPHITLLHPQPLANISPMILIPKIREITKNLNIQIKLEQFDNFNNSVFYINVKSPELLDLQLQLVELLPDQIKAKYFVGRKFVPHITIVQARPKLKLPSIITNRYKQKLSSELPYCFNINSLYKFNRQYSRNYSASIISNSPK